MPITLFEDADGKFELVFPFFSEFPEAHSALRSSGAVHNFPENEIFTKFYILIIHSDLQERNTHGVYLI